MGEKQLDYFCWIDLEKLRWESDYNGYEMGFDETKVISYYSLGNFKFSIDAETGEIKSIYYQNENDCFVCNGENNEKFL